jgi:hypothetical protein
VRFVDGRPVGGITTRWLLWWCAQKLQAVGKEVLLLIWANASRHISEEVRRWLGEHDREVKKSGGEAGVRIVSCLLPKQGPWLNAIEAEWVHALSARWSSPTARWALRSSPRGYAGSSAVRITSIYPSPGR